MSRCPSQEQLEELLAERLTDSMRESLETHIESCPACQQLLELLTCDVVAERAPPFSNAHSQPGSKSKADFLQKVRQTPPPRTDEIPSEFTGTGPPGRDQTTQTTSAQFEVLEGLQANHL